MQVKLTIGERLKDLRVERKLTLEQLSAEVGISKSALGKYESDNGKDISPYSILVLADYYGVSCDYLMGRTETKNHPNTELEAVRQMVLAKREDSANDLYLRTLELAQVPEEEYFGHVVADDLTKILRDIREAHKTDSTTADEPSAAAQAQQQLQTAMNFEGSSDEKKARALLATLGIDYDAITKEQFVNLIEVLRLSKHMKNPINRRGKSNMTHGKGKRKRK